MKLSKEPIMKGSALNYVVVPLMKNEEPIQAPKIHTCVGKTLFTVFNYSFFVIECELSDAKRQKWRIILVSMYSLANWNAIEK